MSLRGVLYPLPGLIFICLFHWSVGKRSGKSQGISETSGPGCGNHINIVHKEDIVVVSHVEFVEFE